eukprot:TRINITY_DN4049_c0_g1_i1.p1 TRINITY_DN4049_c0_g1~~TRINITY_DN4049_c0_g1_i1.p1  ORF type:complete len:1282 (-),score=524.10 TRINITY_DN4049_c0_g1_i1:1898-5743(-)
MKKMISFLFLSLLFSIGSTNERQGPLNKIYESLVCQDAEWCRERIPESGWNGDSSEPSISEITLLLPHPIQNSENSQKNVYHLLHAYNGCFKWSSTNPEVVRVQQIEETINGQTCSRRALVNAMTAGESFSRASSWILAEDKITGKIVRCDVYVDWISNIEIQTKTRTISKDNYEVLEIQAFDSIGNVFSNILGFEFEWSVTAENESRSDSQILALVPFKDANKETPRIVREMEEKGQETSAILVRGVEFGRAIVSAKLKESGYSSVKMTSVPLTVLDPLHIDPSSLYILPDTSFLYHLQVFTKDKITNIPMPSSQYLWEGDNEEIATVDNRGQLVSKNLGDTEVTVSVAEMPESNAKATAHVVLPARLHIVVTNRKDKSQVNNYLVKGWNYHLEVILHDKDGHKVFHSPTLEFATAIPTNRLEIQETSRNQQRFNISAIKEGTCIVNSSLDLSPFSSHLKGKRDSLSARKYLTITDPIQILPRQLLLPFHSEVKHQYPLNGTGGSDPINYRWSSSNSEVVSVSNDGTVTVQGQGQANITLLDKENPSNRDSIVVKVSLPSKIKILADRVEAQVGDSLEMEMEAWDKKGQKFDRCHSLPFVWKRTEEGFSDVNKKNDGKNVVKAKKAGKSKFTVSLGELIDEITLFSFDPLVVLRPSNGEALVTLGSSATFVIKGGPDPWHSDPSKYFTQIVPSHKHNVSVDANSGRASSNNVQSFTVTCLSLGHQNLSISIGNLASSDHLLPVVVNASVSLLCKDPNSLHLTIGSELDSSCSDELHTINTPSSPNTNQPRKFQVKAGRLVPFNFTVLDEEGREFDNSTSLKYDWDSKDKNLAVVQWDRLNNLGHIQVGEQTGSAIIQIKTKNYLPEVLSTHRISYRPDFSSVLLAPEIELFSTPNIRINTERKTIFNHPSNQFELSVEGGSGKYRFSTNDSSIVNIKTIPERPNAFVLTPKQNGMASVVIYDKCLTGSDAAEAIITVSDVAHLHLNVRDLLGLDQEIPLTVEPLDSNHQPFGEDQMKWIDISVNSDNNIVSLDKLEERGRYKVKGKHVGLSRVSAQTKTNSGSMIRSKTTEVHVFAPFQIFPREIILLPQSTLQVETRGGPAIRSEVQYSIQNTRYAKVSEEGIVEGQTIGETRLTAKISAFDSITNEKIVFGQDSVVVRVQDLLGIRIHVSSNNLLSGNEITARVLGINGENPFTYASVPLSFRWQTANGEVIQLRSIYEKANTTVEEEASFAVRLVAKSYGKTRILVKAVSSNPKWNRLEATTEIQLWKKKLHLQFDW